MHRTRRTETTFFPGDFDFDGEWYGWRLRGRLLISPHGDKLTRTRLEGIVWAEALRSRYVKAGLAGGVSGPDAVAGSTVDLAMRPALIAAARGV